MIDQITHEEAVFADLPSFVDLENLDARGDANSGEWINRTTAGQIFCLANFWRIMRWRIADSIQTPSYSVSRSAASTNRAQG